MSEEKKIKTADASGRGTVAGFKVPFPGRQHAYSNDAIEAVVDVMRNAEGQTQGTYLGKFEAAFKEHTGANHTFGVDNCTNALSIAATLCRLGPGDEVIIPAYTFCATAIPFGKTGAQIVWADIDEKRRVVDPDDIERKITSKTKAIVVVHLLGMPVDMPKVLAIAEKHNLRVVEDCAQAIGTSINCQNVGTFGDFGCFSFHGAKAMTTLGEGGMLTVKSDADAKLVAKIRHNGCCLFEGDRQRYWDPAMSKVDVDPEMQVWPNNFCIGEAACAAGIAELKHIDEYNDTLIAQANKLKKALSDVEEISFHEIPEGYKNVYHQFVVHFDGSKIGKSRNDLMDILVNDYKIRVIVQYYPLYRYPLFQKLGAGEYDCPVLEKWWDNTFSFPWWCGIDDETLDYLAISLKSAIATLKNN
ncbi:MAG: DegT/DnrJ/EryC1/StrS family aminotransferase [Planctomycetota bacterium]